MFRFLIASLILSLILSTAAIAAPTDVTPVELTSTGFTDPTGGTFLPTLIPADGVKFPNDDRTFVCLFDSSGGASTLTVAKPAATIRTQYGDVSLSDITIALNSSNENFALIKIPTRYNGSDGKVTLTVSASDYVKIGVFKLAKY